MSKKNYIVSLFIPHLGCPNDCIFCNQRKITNYIEVVQKDEIRNEIRNKLANFPNKSQEDIQIAFYGGSFTGIEETAMIDYLKIANEFIEDGKVRSIRLSTRPDYIDKHILNILKEFNVETIELGVQSMLDSVLDSNLRCHYSQCVRTSSELIKSMGFSLGLQMMTGLYKSTTEMDLYTADELIKLQPDFVRIYPTLVIKNTMLETFTKINKYSPENLHDSVENCTKIYLKFINANIPVIRLGLLNTENIKQGEDVVAGAIHPNYRQLVEDNLYRKVVDYVLKNDNLEALEIHAKPNILNNFVGYNGENKKYFKEKYGLKIIKYSNSNNNFLVLDHINKIDINLENIFKNIEKEV